MEIKLYRNFQKRINSTKRPDNTVTVITDDVKLKQNTSISNPTFLIYGVNLSCNYVYVPDLKRYYFVDDITLITNELYELKCSCDVLATYKDYIGNYEAFVERSQSEYVVNFNDDLVSSEQGVQVVTTATTDLGFIAAETGCYLLRIIGKNGVVNSWASLYLSDFEDILNPDLVEAALEADLKELGALIFDAASYIVGAYWMPLAVAYLPGGTGKVSIKYYESGVTATRVSGFKKINNLSISKPTAYYNDFRAYNPRFTSYQIYFPGVGGIDIPSDVMKKALSVDVMLDYQNGTIVYGLQAAGDLIGTYTGNIYTQIPISNTSQDVSNTLTSAASAIGALAAGNIPLAATSLVGTAHNIVAPTPSISGGYQSAAQIKMFPDIIVTQTVHGSGDIPDTVAGRPLFKKKTIKNLSGFVKCGATSLSFDGLSSDIQAVNGMMTEGFYYE